MKTNRHPWWLALAILPFSVASARCEEQAPRMPLITAAARAGDSTTAPKGVKHGPDASPLPVPTLHTTDLYRPHDDPDDHWDLASQYALAWQGKVDLRGVVIDYPRRTNAPDICAVSQMNHITGKAVPLVVGAPRRMPAEEVRKDATAKLAGVRAFLELIRQSPRPVVIHIVGGCQDVAYAARLEPELFARQCAAIYLNAGVGTPDPRKQHGLECNVGYDPASYAAMFKLPCPVYWLPCFEVLRSSAGEKACVAEYGSFYRFHQGEILPHLSDRVQNYFMSMYVGGQSATSLWFHQLEGPKDAAAIATESQRDRAMWCTAGFLHAVGLTVTKAGAIVPRNSVSDPVFVFEPIRVTCSDAGVTEWTKDPQSKDRFIFRITDTQKYQSAMTSALKSLLARLP
jgi:hypothetical protein